MVLAEKGVEYDLVTIDMVAGAHHLPEYQRRYPIFAATPPKK